MPSKIDVLLIDGSHDHYLVPVAMNASAVQVGAETYVRTEEIRPVQQKHGGLGRFRVYRPGLTPQLLDVEDV